MEQDPSTGTDLLCCLAQENGKEAKDQQPDFYTSFPWGEAKGS